MGDDCRVTDDRGRAAAAAGRRARLEVVGAAALFSTGGAAIKGTGFAGLRGGLQVACLRSAVAAVALALMLPGARRAWTWRTTAVGAAYGATLVLFVVANKLTTAADAIFLQSTAPLYVLLGGIVLLHERVRGRDVAYMVVLAGGMALVLAGSVDPGATAPRPVLGNVIALCAGVTWAATVLGLRWLARGPGPQAAAGAALAGNVLAAVACLPALLLPGAQAGDAGDWLLITYLGVVQVALAYVLLTRGMRTITAFETSLLLFVEPALNPVWAWLAHGEAPGAASIAGGAVILGATVAKTWLDMRFPPRAGRSPPAPEAA